MKRCRLKRCNFKIKTKMSKDNKTSDKQQNINSMLVANGMPTFGTKEFNDMCSKFFGGKPKSN